MSRFKYWILNKVFEYLFPFSDVAKILTSDKQGHLYLGGVLIEKQKLSDLKNEVRLLKNTGIWEIITYTLKHQAQETIFSKSLDYQDLINGKMILYTINVQEKMIEKIDKAKE